MIKLVNLTSNAIKRLKYLKDFKDKYLYINITGGGCSGFQYNFDLINYNNCNNSTSSINNNITNNSKDSNNDTNTDSNYEKKVVIYDDNVVKIFSNPESSELMNGCTLDFQHELIGSKFILDDIQNSVRKCSCGNSFELKDDL